MEILPGSRDRMASGPFRHWLAIGVSVACLPGLLLLGGVSFYSGSQLSMEIAINVTEGNVSLMHAVL